MDCGDLSSSILNGFLHVTGYGMNSITGLKEGMFMKVFNRTKMREKKEIPPRLSVAFLLVGVCGLLSLLYDIDNNAFFTWLKAFCGDIVEGEALETAAVIFSVLVLAALLAFVLYIVEIVLKMHWMMCIVIAMLILVGSRYYMSPSLWSVALLTLFLIGFQVVHTSYFRAEGGRLIEKNVAVMGALTILILSVSFIFVSANEEWLYNSTYAVEGYFYRISKRLSGSADKPVSGGRISTGNNYRTGVRVFEIYSDQKPEETMYLRGFSGGTYADGEWEAADDEALLEEVAVKIGWQDWFNMVEAMYNSMYFVSNGKMTDEREPRLLRVIHSSGEYQDFYEPYYGFWNRKKTLEQSEGYFYDYYEKKDMNIDWEKILPNYEMQTDWYRTVQEMYMEEAKIAYTQVPVETLPRLAALCRGNSWKDTKEVTAFIRDTLNGSASYTLTPGLSSFRGDIVEDFLFEKHRGYCVHYASAAVLMYRLFGIPARYVSGYAVSPSEFLRQEDGTYRAYVTDEASHAWAEIFLEDYGWTPVEVTPSDNDTVDTVSPVLNPGDSRLMRRERESGFSENRAEAEEENSKEPKADEDGKQGAAGDFGGSKGETRIFSVWAFCLFCAVCFVLLFFNYRRLWCLKRIERMGCRRIFARFVRMLHFSGCLAQYDGGEADFADKVFAEISEIPKENIRKLLAIVSEAAYGPESVSKEKEEAARGIYKQYAVYVYGRLGTIKKLVFRYWKVFG